MKSTKTPSFKKGDIVTWTSQASGFKKKKTGKIVDVLKPGELTNLCNRGQWHQMNSPRSHRSYIVDVKGKLYWPLVKYLKLKGGR